MKCCELLTCYVLIEFFIMLTAVNLITHGNQVYEGTTCSFFFIYKSTFQILEKEYIINLY